MSTTASRRTDTRLIGCGCAPSIRRRGLAPSRSAAVFPLEAAFLAATPAPAAPPPLALAELQAGHLAPDGSIADVPGVLARVYASGVAPALRPRLWLHLLGVAPWGASAAELGALGAERAERYAAALQLWSGADAEGRLAECAHGCVARYHRIVETDVPRTDRCLERWAADASLAPLRRLLLSACAASASPGYHQGMNDLAAVLLVAFGGDEPDAYAALLGLLRRMAPSFEVGQRGIWRQAHAALAALGEIDPSLRDALLGAGAVSEGGECLVLFQPLLLALKREIGNGPHGNYAHVCAAWEAWWAAADAQAPADGRAPVACAHFQLVLVLAHLELHRAAIRANRTGIAGLSKLLGGARGPSEGGEVLGCARAIHALMWGHVQASGPDSAGSAGPLRAILSSRRLLDGPVPCTTAGRPEEASPAAALPLEPA